MVDKELLERIKEQCENTDCADCFLSVGVYMEGLDYTYYSCDIRKKPKDWDLEKTRMKQTKKSKKEKEKAERKAAKEVKEKVKNKETKKRGRKKKEK